LGEGDVVGSQRWHRRQSDGGFLYDTIW